MIAAPCMQKLVQEYLEERRSLGFELQIAGEQLMAFARFADQRGHGGTLTEQLIVDWVQGRAKRATPITWARRLEIIRPFARYCARFESATYIPQKAPSAQATGASRLISIPTRRSPISCIKQVNSIRLAVFVQQLTRHCSASSPPPDYASLKL